MADYFDPSPRSSKRRKTATYKAVRSILDTPEDSATGRAKSVEQTSVRQDGFEDSAYGSKEDSHVEDESGVADKHGRSGHSNSLTSKEQDSKDKPAPRRSKKQVAEKEPTPRSDLDKGDENAKNAVTVQPRSSGRERRRPRRYSISPEKPKQWEPIQPVDKAKNDGVGSVSGKKVPSTKVATPKGILTPSRREKRVGPRKSVIFDQGEKDIEEQFGFKDINRSIKKTSSRPGSQVGKSASNLTQDTSSPTVNRTSQQRPTAISVTVAPSGLDPDSDDNFAEITDVLTVEPVATQDDGSEISALSLDDDPTVLAIKSIVLNRLVFRGTMQIPCHLQNQYDTLHSLLQATVTSGESNSILLLGAKGTGKIRLLDSAIADLSENHVDDFHTVRLNGLYQTDDKVALREIWRQLGREMQVKEMESGEAGGSYADTMSSLLSLLSHPDEFVDAETAMELDAGVVRTSKSIVFILDEFDLFTTHPRQTLLYNLFDIAQSKKAPIAVIGCTTRMDVVDCLEKRVKSRFSHRWLHIPSAKTLDDFHEIVKSALCIESEGVAVIKLSENEIKTREMWNEYVQSTFLLSRQIQDSVNRVFYTTKSIAELFSALYIPVATVQLPAPTQDDQRMIKLSETICTTTQPTSLTILPSLPTLHLALLIAASRLDTIHNLTTLNFNLVYAHYVELISRSKLQVTASGAVAVGASLRQWSSETAISAWEDLGLYECIVPVSGAAVVGAGSKDGGSLASDFVGGESANVRMWRVDITLDDLGWAVKEKWTESGGVRDVLRKWCREI